ncbi:hypothetical protein, partial [Prescottella soli]
MNALVAQTLIRYPGGLKKQRGSWLAVNRAPGRPVTVGPAEGEAAWPLARQLFSDIGMRTPRSRAVSMACS